MIIVSVSHTPTLVVGVRHYVCIQCPDVYRVPLTDSFTKLVSDPFFWHAIFAPGFGYYPSSFELNQQWG